MTTRLANGFPGTICKVCNGCGQERYKVSSLPAEFNAANGRYENDLFIRKCLTCDGLGAIEDVSVAANAPYTSNNLTSGLGGHPMPIGWGLFG